MINVFKNLKQLRIFDSLLLQASSSGKFCDSDIEYSSRDPEIILNEIKKSTNMEYDSVKRELESMKCEESSAK